MPSKNLCGQRLQSKCYCRRQHFHQFGLSDGRHCSPPSSGDDCLIAKVAIICPAYLYVRCFHFNVQNCKRNISVPVIITVSVQYCCKVSISASTASTYPSASNHNSYTSTVKRYHLVSGLSDFFLSWPLVFFFSHVAFVFKEQWEVLLHGKAIVDLKHFQRHFASVALNNSTHFGSGWICEIYLCAISIFKEMKKRKWSDEWENETRKESWIKERMVNQSEKRRWWACWRGGGAWWRWTPGVFCSSSAFNCISNQVTISKSGWNEIAN